MPAGYSRVTVVSDSRRVDVALPAALPVTDLLPQLLRLCSPPQPGSQHPVSWALVRFNGTLLQPEASLFESGVIDGEVLELRGGASAGRPAYVEDVRDSVEDVVDGSGRLWRGQISLRFALIAASLGMFALLFDPAVRASGSFAALGLAAVVAIALCGAGWWAGTQGEPSSGRLAIVVGCLWAGLAGWLGVLAAGGSMPLAGAVALVAALVLASLVRAGTPLAAGHLAGFAVAGAVGCVRRGHRPAGWADRRRDPDRSGAAGRGRRRDASVVPVGRRPRLGRLPGALGRSDGLEHADRPAVPQRRLAGRRADGHRPAD
ncbi:EsaB/YukD family protein [Fodinicola feengrottensis]|uniref:EsaB/YukD family protein n=1 Tax=Fodinicola feengrottensis TaxID=435914 RepID=UPI0013D8987C|nr:EsaB/YukD family protein [Fodinicola feengrottensis]